MLFHYTQKGTITGDFLVDGSPPYVRAATS